MNTSQISIRGENIGNIGIEPTSITGEGGPRCPRNSSSHLLFNRDLLHVGLWNIK